MNYFELGCVMGELKVATEGRREAIIKELK